MAENVPANRAQMYRDVERMLGRVPEWLKRMPDEVVNGFWALYSSFDLGETKIPNKFCDATRA